MAAYKIGNLAKNWTLSGRPLYLEESSQQNWMRYKLSESQSLIWSTVVNFPVPENIKEQVQLTAEALAANRENPAHYGGHIPRWYTYLGKPLMPEPIYTFYDLLSFGVSTKDGLPAFLRVCGLAPEIELRVVLATTILLMVDDAICAFDEGNIAVGGYHAMLVAQTAESFLGMFHSGSTDEKVLEQLRSVLSKRGRAAGIASGDARKQTAKAPPELVAKARDELVAQGRSIRDISAILAVRFNVTSDYIRRVLKKNRT